MTSSFQSQKIRITLKQGIDLKDAIDALTDLIIGKKTKSSTKKTASRKKTTKPRTRKKVK